MTDESQDDLSSVLRNWRRTCESASELAETKTRAATAARDETIKLATEAAQVAVDLLMPPDRKMTLTWKGNPDA